MNLEDAIRHAQGCYAEPPPHETATCDWVILPLLHATGYLPREIAPQLKDLNKKYPDYTILPNTLLTWFVEAKAWRVALEDQQVIQALNYANHSGKRWVVLSNGQLWRLYDNSIQGVAHEKLVSEVSLDDTREMAELLSSLGKESITSNQISTYASQKVAERRSRERRIKIDRCLNAQILESESAVVTAIVSTLAKETGILDVNPSEVVDFFASSARSSNAESSSSKEKESEAKPEPDLRGRIVAKCQELVSQSPLLLVERMPYYGAVFVAKSWEDLPRVPPVWSKTGSLVLFWISVEVDRVKLILEIGPGPQDLRQRAYDSAKSHSKPFNPIGNTMYPKYSRIYRKNLLSTEEFASNDFEAIEDHLLANWATFMTVDFPELDQTMLSALT